MQLSKIEPGQSATVEALDGPPHIKQRLREMGITVGMAITVVRRAPLGDPIDILVRGYHLSLRATEAAHVMVEPRAGVS